MWGEDKTLNTTKSVDTTGWEEQQFPNSISQSPSFSVHERYFSPWGESCWCSGIYRGRCSPLQHSSYAQWWGLVSQPTSPSAGKKSVQTAIARSTSNDANKTRNKCAFRSRESQKADTRDPFLVSVILASFTLDVFIPWTLLFPTLEPGTGEKTGTQSPILCCSDDTWELPADKLQQNRATLVFVTPHWGCAFFFVKRISGCPINSIHVLVCLVGKQPVRIQTSSCLQAQSLSINDQTLAKQYYLEPA